MPDGRDILLFLGSPRISTLEEMMKRELYLCDILPHDMSADFIVMAERHQSKAILAAKLEVRGG